MKLYWNRFFNKYTVSLLIIIIGIFCAYYFKNVLEGLSPGQNVATSSEKCGEFTTANKLLTHTIANTSSDTILNSITSQIAACENLIDEINQYLPLSINDIKVGTVTQSALGNTAPSITIVITPPPQIPQGVSPTPARVAPVPVGVSPTPASVSPGPVGVSPAPVMVSPTPAGAAVPGTYANTSNQYSQAGSTSGSGFSASPISSATPVSSATPSATPSVIPVFAPSPSLGPSSSPSPSQGFAPSSGRGFAPADSASPGQSQTTNLITLPSFPIIQPGATWTINAVLPLGLQGATGPAGPAGANGMQGPMGKKGPVGSRGLPGKVQGSSTTSYNSFNEPFRPR